MKIVQILITLSAVLIGLGHLIWPSLEIDAITLTLLIVAVAPWLAPLLKSLELPGGLKFEFQELEKAKQRGEGSGLVDDKPVQEFPQYAFLEFAESNPSLALAGLRMELEKSLKTLAERKGIENKQHGIAFLMRDLHNQQVISNQEKAASADMITTLNRAVHGEEFDYRTAQWVLDVGPRLLSSINKTKKA